MAKNEKEYGTEIIRSKTWKQQALDYLMITFACVVYAAAVALFLDPNSLAPGGVTGIAIILNRLTQIETGTWIMLINIPILLLGTWKFGLRFIVSTFYCTMLISVCTNRLSPIGAVTENPFLASITGSALAAIALGCIFKAGATSGGQDIIVKIIRLKAPHLKTGMIFLITDAVIVAASAVVFKDIDTAIYAGLTVVLISRIMDIVLYGQDEAKLFYIISEHPARIARRLLENLEVGVTFLQGEGGYTSEDKRVIFCAVKKRLAPKVEVIVKEEDLKAFMIVTSATEIFGEGYKSYFSEKL